MWIIFRGRVGGGGRLISSFAAFLLLPEEVRFRRGPVLSALCVGDVGVAGLYEEAETDADADAESEETLRGESRSWACIAGGGRAKKASGETRRSFAGPLMSVDAAGGGGGLGRGITWVCSQWAMKQGNGTSTAAGNGAF
jgi:hypothetical protein